MFPKEEYLCNDDKQDQSEEQEEYAVEKIVDKRYLNGRINYLIKWKGYDDKDNTWEPIDNLFCSDLIEKFEKTYKNTESHRHKSIGEMSQNLQQTENVWNVESIYEFYYFNCPSCPYRNEFKQDFVNHSYNSHPESVNYLKKISDGSLNDITSPWKLFGEEITEKFKNDINEIHELQDEDNGQMENEEEFLENKYEDKESIDIKVQDNLEISDNEEFTNLSKHVYEDSFEMKVETLISDDDKKGSDGNSQIEAESSAAMKNEATSEHKCDTCGESFSRPMFLKKHMNTVHETHFDNKCAFCEKWFQDSKNLWTHNYKYHRETMNKDFKCGTCEKTFLTKEQLRRHSYHHDGKSKCDVCNLSFSRSHDLKRHKRRVSCLIYLLHTHFTIYLIIN